MEGSIKAAPELSAGCAAGRPSASVSATRSSPTCEDLTQKEVRETRAKLGVTPVYGLRRHLLRRVPRQNAVSVLELRGESESDVSSKKKVVILGGGPNRIGQGIEFDYCCCHAVFALREVGHREPSCQLHPETVSTDYAHLRRFCIRALTLEGRTAICHEEAQKGELLGVIVQFGGQTPLKLAVPLEEAGIRLLGTSADAIDRAEDRERFDALLTKLNLMRRARGIARAWVRTLQQFNHWPRRRPTRPDQPGKPMLSAIASASPTLLAMPPRER